MEQTVFIALLFWRNMNGRMGCEWVLETMKGGYTRTHEIIEESCAISNKQPKLYMRRKNNNKSDDLKRVSEVKECERNHFGVIQSLWSCNSYFFGFVATIKPNIAGAKSLTPLRRAILLARSLGALA